MAPDRGFTKQLKALDSELEVVWNWGWKRWEIWRFTKDKPGVHILTVQTENKEYRELGADILMKLQAGDLRKYGPNKILAYLEELERQVRRRKEQEFRNKIESIAKDTFNYARGVLQIQVPLKYRLGDIIHA